MLNQYKNWFFAGKSEIGFYINIQPETKLKENSPCPKIVSKVPLHDTEWIDQQVEQLVKNGVF